MGYFVGDERRGGGQRRRPLVEMLLFLGFLMTPPPGSARAQDGAGAPGGFFPENYVSDYDVLPKREAPTPRPKRTRSKSEAPDGLLDERSGFFQNDGEDLSAAPSPTPEPVVRGTNQKVLSVSGFITGKTIAEALMELAEAGRVLRERRIPSRHVSIVCNPLEFPAQLKEHFKPISENPALLHGYIWMSPVLRLINAVPDRYKVTSSPVWLIETAEGESIIEGEGPTLEEMISPEGEFLLPTGGEEVTQLPPPPAIRR